MADRYLLESGSPDGYLLEDGSGDLLLDWSPTGLTGIAAWYDPSDLSTLFQDAAGTTPVTTTGQPVGRMLDKSGNGNHLTQATSAARPTLGSSGSTYYLDFDGVDDQLSINSAGLRITGALTISLVGYKNGGSSYGGIASAQTNAGTVNAFEFRFSSHATVAQPELVDASGAAAETVTAAGPGNVGTLAAFHTFSVRRTAATDAELSCDGSRGSLQSLTLTPTSDSSSTFVLGNRNAGGIPLAGRIGKIAIVSARLGDTDLATLEAYLSATAYSLTAASGSFAVTGAAATLTKALKLAASAAGFTITGSSATLTKGYRLSATASSFALTGSVASLRVARRLTSSAGGYALAGSAAALKVGHTLTASSSAFVLTGKAANLPIARRLTASAASYTLSGKTANLPIGRKLTASAASYSLTGSTASLRQARKLTASAGSFALNGSAATLLRALRLTASSGGFALTGSAATLTKVAGAGSAYSLTASAGAFTLTGSRAIFWLIEAQEAEAHTIRPTRGGWRKAGAGTGNWGPGDNARGAQWSETAKGPNTFAPGDNSRGTSWNTKAKGQSTW